MSIRRGSRSGPNGHSTTVKVSVTRNRASHPVPPYYMASNGPMVGAYPPMNPGYPGALPAEPRATLEAGDLTPYVNQGSIYTVRVVSSSAVRTLNPVLPASDAVVVETVEGPISSTRMGRAGPEYINLYRFSVTPLRSGRVEIPPIQMRGTMAPAMSWYGPMAPGGSGEDFLVSTGESIKLDVKPASADVQPWLPLQDLRISGHLAPERRMQIGEPMTLTVEMVAVGATGSMLPSAIEQLQGDNFQVYRDSVHTEESLQGTRLLGKRIETYTLVPVSGGHLKVPVIEVAWWNTDRDRAEVSSLPLRSLIVSGEGSSPRSVEIPQKRNTTVAFWSAVITALVMTVGFWVWNWLRHSKAGSRAARYGLVKLERGRRGLSRRAAILAGLFATNNAWQRMRYRVVMMMPAPVKLWMCSKCISQEQDPAEWCQLFKFLACKHLGVATQTPLPAIADRIVETNPGADAGRIHALVRELDGAMYGDESIDFEVWKKEFRKELRPGIPRPGQRGAPDDSKMPALNPEAPAG